MNKMSCLNTFENDRILNGSHFVRWHCKKGASLPSPAALFFLGLNCVVKSGLLRQGPHQNYWELSRNHLCHHVWQATTYRCNNLPHKRLALHYNCRWHFPLKLHTRTSHAGGISSVQTGRVSSWVRRLFTTLVSSTCFNFVFKYLD